MSLSCYHITCHYDIFLHGYAHYAFASTIEFHGEFHRGDQNNNSIWQNCDQRRRIARKATDRQSPSPSLSVRENAPKKERRDFAKENNHRYLCRFASRRADSCKKMFLYSLVLYRTLVAKYIRSHTCARAYFAQKSRQNKKNILPAPS